MQNYNDSITKDEIDLLEIFLTLWAFKYLIALLCVTGIAIGTYKSMVAEKRFTAIATYKIFSQSNGGIGFSQGNGAISLAAVTGSIKNEELAPRDQVMGRNFIETLNKNVNFRDDTFYNPKPIAEAQWRILLKNLIGWKSVTLNSEEAVWQGIISKFRSTVMLEETLGGAVKISATHRDPRRSAEIANAVMLKIIESSKNKAKTEQEDQLKYLSTTLSKSLEELEKSSDNLKQFTLQNSTVPLEEFSIRAQQLNISREDLELTTKIHDALGELIFLLEAGTTSNEDYKTLREKHPIVDEVSFRRVLGQNEIITIWSWPEPSIAVTVFNTLSDRQARLALQVSNMQLEASKLSNEVEIYASLKRNLEIAEASYAVLIEQVKAQKTVAGFRPETSEIYEYAAPPLYPSSPNRNNLMALGGTLGLLISCSLAYIYSLFRGAYYSKRSIVYAAKAKLVINAKTLSSLKRKSISKIIKNLPNKSLSLLRSIAVEIHQSDSSFVILTSSNTKLKSIDLAHATASYMQTKDLKVAVINFSEYKKDFINKTIKSTVGSFNIIEEIEQVSILRPINSTKPIDTLGEKDFQTQIKSLLPKFNYIILCADNTDAMSLASAVNGINVVHISMARRRKTISQSFAQLTEILPVQGLLYE